MAVLGRILGHGQEWAYVPLVQAALLIAVSAVVAAAFRPFGPRHRVAHDPTDRRRWNRSRQADLVPRASMTAPATTSPAVASSAPVTT